MSKLAASAFYAAIVDRLQQRAERGLASDGQALIYGASPHDSAGAVLYVSDAVAELAEREGVDLGEIGRTLLERDLPPGLLPLLDRNTRTADQDA